MKPLSLKMRAIGLLSQREHSLLELRRKLLRIVRQQRAAEAETCGQREGVLDDAEINDARRGADESASAEDEVDALLAWLQAHDYLSEVRFVEARIHARARRFGSLRIKQELAQHGLALSAENQAELKASELERAKAIWQRKFGGDLPEDQAARAKQSRFLVARGFSSEVVRRLLRADFG